MAAFRSTGVQRQTRDELDDELNDYDIIGDNESLGGSDLGFELLDPNDFPTTFPGHQNSTRAAAEEQEDDRMSVISVDSFTSHASRASHARTEATESSIVCPLTLEEMRGGWVPLGTLSPHSILHHSLRGMCVVLSGPNLQSQRTVVSTGKCTSAPRLKSGSARMALHPSPAPLCGSVTSALPNPTVITTTMTTMTRPLCVPTLPSCPWSPILACDFSPSLTAPPWCGFPGQISTETGWPLGPMGAGMNEDLPLGSGGGASYLEALTTGAGGLNSTQALRLTPRFINQQRVAMQGQHHRQLQLRMKKQIARKAREERRAAAREAEEEDDLEDFIYRQYGAVKGSTSTAAHVRYNKSRFRGIAVPVPTLTARLTAIPGISPVSWFAVCFSSRPT